jgi:hypothetical protein
MSFWDQMKDRFGIFLVDGGFGSDKDFMTEKTYYNSGRTKFYRSFSFSLSEDVLIIYTYLLRDFNKETIRVATPLLKDGELLEMWKVYSPFSVEMISWVFEFYVLFDTMSWELPWESVPHEKDVMHLGIIHQSLEGMFSIKGDVVDPKMIIHRMSEGLVTKPRRWFNAECYTGSKNVKESLLISFDSDSCERCDRLIGFCKCGEILKEEILLGQEVESKTLDERLKVHNKLSKFPPRQSVRIASSDIPFLSAPNNSNVLKIDPALQLTPKEMYIQEKVKNMSWEEAKEF